MNSQIQRVCEAIVKHVKNVTLGHHVVSRMSFYMKTDIEGHLWFLWFTSLRTTTTDLPGEGSIYKWINFNVGLKNVASKYKNTKGKTVAPPSPREKGIKTEETHEYYYYSPSFIDNKLSKNLACPSCHSIFERSTFVNVSYLVTILKFESDYGIDPRVYHEDQDLIRVRIPPLLQSLESSIGPVRYRKMRHNDIFLSKTFKVCENCANTLSTVAKRHDLDLLGKSTVVPKPPAPVGVSSRINELATCRHMTLSLAREADSRRIANNYARPFIDEEEEEEDEDHNAME
ncbi:hypothetical protein AKO1_007690 [Acrasis kona]|uniref:Uncharacterized protein n=1 Tax=Acrasis kona TaxID=1008807 RepID=A0AAW2YQK1_9EUKA